MECTTDLAGTVTGGFTRSITNGVAMSVTGGITNGVESVVREGAGANISHVEQAGLQTAAGHNEQVESVVREGTGANISHAEQAGLQTAAGHNEHGGVALEGAGEHLFCWERTELETTMDGQAVAGRNESREFYGKQCALGTTVSDLCMVYDVREVSDAGHVASECVAEQG